MIMWLAHCVECGGGTLTGSYKRRGETKMMEAMFSETASWWSVWYFKDWIYYGQTIMIKKSCQTYQRGTFHTFKMF